MAASVSISYEAAADTNEYIHRMHIYIYIYICKLAYIQRYSTCKPSELFEQRHKHRSTISIIAHAMAAPQELTDPTQDHQAPKRKQLQAHIVSSQSFVQQAKAIPNIHADTEGRIPAFRSICVPFVDVLFWTWQLCSTQILLQATELQKHTDTNAELGKDKNIEQRRCFFFGDFLIVQRPHRRSPATKNII